MTARGVSRCRWLGGDPSTGSGHRLSLRNLTLVQDFSSQGSGAGSSRFHFEASVLIFPPRRRPVGRASSFGRCADGPSAVHGEPQRIRDIPAGFSVHIVKNEDDTLPVAQGRHGLIERGLKLGLFRYTVRGACFEQLGIRRPSARVDFVHHEYGVRVRKRPLPCFSPLYNKTFKRPKRLRGTHTVS